MVVVFSAGLNQDRWLVKNEMWVMSAAACNHGVQLLLLPSLEIPSKPVHVLLSDL